MTIDKNRTTWNNLELQRKPKQRTENPRVASSILALGNFHSLRAMGSLKLCSCSEKVKF